MFQPARGREALLGEARTAERPLTRARVELPYKMQGTLLDLNFR